ncbi:type IV secretory system conjugative DNA transfer family protein [Nocardia sp. CY41]|uniref:type IV secretory system conjugative DNA transfer family protein n=1 Tax=Nocardia sp. CY41 TaxID=2608686 RepID=UPI00135BC382|nr:TraM recognition domain-containing protein [Nocardia sp. CY41]
MTSQNAPQPMLPTGYKVTAGLIAVALTALLGGAGLSGVLVGNGFAGPHRGLFATLSGWLSHPGDPAAAWTGEPRPGPAWMVYTLVFAIAAVLLTGWWFAAVEWRSRQLRQEAHTPGLATTRDVAGVLDARGATEHAKKLRAANAAAPTPQIDAAELVTPLGDNDADGEPIALRPNDSLLVFGGSGSGKTWRTAVRQILFAPGAVALTTTKPDILRATCLARSKKGFIAVFDPEQIAEGWPDRLRWSPIAGSEDPDAATRRAEGLVAARPMGTGNSEASAFYAGRATVVIQCYLHAAALDGRRMPEIRRWSALTNNGEVLRILEKHRPDWAGDFRQATASGDPKTDANTMSTVSDILKPLASPKLMAAVDVEASESFDVEQFIGGANTLYLLSEGGAKSMAPFVSALTTEVHYRAKRLALRQREGRLDPYMRMVLDEVANVAPIPGLPDMLTDSGGRGISIMAFAHGRSQLRNRFGDGQARQLVESASALLILPGLMSHELLEEISALLGNIEVSRQIQVGPNQWRDDLREHRIMTTQAIRMMPDGQGLLLYRNQPGVKLRVRAWFEGDEQQAALVRASMDHYDRIIATGTIPEAEPAPVIDPTSAVEATSSADWVMDFTKGWGKRK